jgi:signal transduction histidine kinase
MQDLALNRSTSALPFWRQFRFNLILAFIVVAVVPLILVALLNISQQTSQIETQTTRQLESIVELKDSQIDLWLDEAELAFDFILADDNFRELLVQSASDREGVSQETIDASIGRIKALIQSNDYFDRIIVYDTNGEVLLASSDTDLGKLVELQPYFNQSLAQERYIQPPFFDLSTTELTMMITRQLQDANGQVVGVFAGQMNLEVLGNIMTERTGLGDTGETYLVSRQNNFLLTPSRFAGYELARAYQSEAIETVLQEQAGNGIYENYQSPPQRVLGVYRWIPELEAGLISEVNEEQVLIGIRQSQTNFAVLAGIAVLVAIGGGLIYANLISRPIANLTGITEQYAQGNLTLRADTQSQNEIGQLASAFNTMAQAIQDRQANLNELNQSLEKRVEERTAELREARDEALAAQRIAKENSRLKSEFLSTMSHELRTPLNAIEGFTSIMLGGMGIELSPRAEDMVKRVSSNSRRLLQLINDFLDLSRIEAGRLELVKSPVSPEKLVHKWQNQVGVLAEEKGLEFITIIDPELPPALLGDEDALSKIAINLLSNAFKFTPKGTVTLALRRAAAGWTIAVSDTGIGIPSHAREYIFEEFRQVDGSSKRLYGGTGLGLSLVQKLARAMGGSVSLQSELGQGSTFTVTLPLEVEPAQEGISA